MKGVTAPRLGAASDAIHPTRDGAASAAAFRLGYRPALDGLRAVAVAAVIAFHGNVSFVRGGYFGVDIFFVLSGFLITDRLLEERVRTGVLSYGSFYARRALRLLPALAVVLVVTVAYAQVHEAAGMAGMIRRSALAAALYVANWYDVARKAVFPMPLSHTWSLAIEEQFYLIWPLLLMLALGRARDLRRAFWITVGLAAASAVFFVAIAQTGADGRLRAYNGLDTRAQALLAGAAVMIAAFVGWLPRARAAKRLTRTAAALAWAVLVVVLSRARFGHIHSFDMYPLVAAAVAVILVDLSLPGGVAARVLGLRPLRFIGRISYGLYLWHWPVMFWCTSQQLGGLAFWPTFLVQCAITFALSLASFALVERPMLRLKGRFERVEDPVPVAAVV